VQDPPAEQVTCDRAGESAGADEEDIRYAAHDDAFAPSITPDESGNVDDHEDEGGGGQGRFPC
jgi:hypothetical protein